MRIKICGVTRREDARLAGELGAWAVGFVFAKDSPRLVTLEKAAAAREALPKTTLAVGVFADAKREQVLDALRVGRLDALQFHGKETPDDCRGYPVPVYKAIAAGADRRELERYPVAGFLIEPPRTIDERRARAPVGVTAQRKAWDAAAGFSGLNVILAGGLTPENVRKAVQSARPFAVDVSGGVERSFGVKDAKKLRAFFKAVDDL